MITHKSYNYDVCNFKYDLLILIIQLIYDERREHFYFEICYNLE